MSKDTGKKSFLDFFKMKDLDDDEYDDDLFDDDEEDDDDEEYRSKSKKSGSLFSRNNRNNQAEQVRPQQPVNPRANTTGQYNTNNYRSSVGQAQYRTATQSQQSYTQPRQQYRQPAPANNNKLVDFNNRQQRTESYRGKSEVYVIKPQEISESQTVTDFLKNGKTIVINMEGLELAPAQRIIDFIGGAVYALNGSLQAISANIFIAAPETIEVSGDLREEILNSSTVSPQLGRY